MAVGRRETRCRENNFCRFGCGHANEYLHPKRLRHDNGSLGCFYTFLFIFGGRVCVCVCVVCVCVCSVCVCVCGVCMCVCVCVCVCGVCVCVQNRASRSR